MDGVGRYQRIGISSNRDRLFRRLIEQAALGLERPEHGRAIQSAATIACAHIVGGLIPIAPYFLASGVSVALPYSIVLTLLALTGFGYFKGGFTGTSRLRSAVQTLSVGGIAAAAAYLLASTIS
jgi:VIT1/CCC1 family predicted Fe2+/Mn2+ transporter